MVCPNCSQEFFATLPDESTWNQTRVHTPTRTEALTPLANGRLYCTTKRLLFHGDSRNTKVDLRKIVDVHILSDALKVEKATGKPDYFSMNAGQARFFTALIGRFRRAKPKFSHPLWFPELLPNYAQSLFQEFGSLLAIGQALWNGCDNSEERTLC